jgi:deoxyribose-phosphate aldolase
LQAGADFIKTSTGKMPVSATPEAAVIMCHALKFWYEITGEKKGFKPAGGISQSGDALLFLTIAQNILGTEWVNSHRFRIGASRLANHLLSEILHRPINHF